MPTRLALTAEQRHASATPAEHAFIIAAPGAGKTTVAAERYGVCRYLRAQPGKRTLGVSFARSATQELRQRVQGRWGMDAVTWPHDIRTLDSLHCELLKHLLVTGTLRWPGAHSELTVLDTWRGQTGARYLLPTQRWHRVATVKGRDITSHGIPISQAMHGIATKAPFEQHLASGVCTHAEVRAVLSAVFSREDLCPVVLDYLRNTTSSLIVDEVFDGNRLDINLIYLAGHSGISTTLIGDPWQALYEFRGAQPELVPMLVEGQGYKTFPVTQSFRFTTTEMHRLTTELRAGHSTVVQSGSTADVDVVLASAWDTLWKTDARVLPLSFGKIDNQTDAAIILLLDQVVAAHFGCRAIFAQEAMTLLGIDVDEYRNDGAALLRPVLETLSAATPHAATSAIQQLRKALKELGSPRQLRALSVASETAQEERLRALALRLNNGECVPGMTIHQAKGKEWRVVGVRLTSAQIDRLHAGLSEKSAEDRAIYVALTRARELARLI